MKHPQKRRQEKGQRDQWMAVEWKEEAAERQRNKRREGTTCKGKRCLEQKNSGKHRKEKLDEFNQGSDNTTAWYSEKRERERRECKKKYVKRSIEVTEITKQWQLEIKSKGKGKKWIIRDYKGHRKGNHEWEIPNKRTIQMSTKYETWQKNWRRSELELKRPREPSGRGGGGWWDVKGRIIIWGAVN